MSGAVYFAGPDVFRPDVAAWRHGVLEACASSGFDALIPCDAELSGAAAIWQGNLDLIRSATAVVANADPFRGAEMDSGTAYEIGYAVALGKPVVVYVSSSESLLQRVDRMHGPVRPSAEGMFRWVDRDGFGVESFDLPVNLMIGNGVSLVVGGVGEALNELKRLMPAAALLAA